MFDSLKLFEKNIKEASHLLVLFDYATKNLMSMDFSDLLRACFIYSVSAFDKLIHDLIRIGMIEIFLGKRSQTPKYLAEAISLETHGKIFNATKSSGVTMLPKEYYFELEIKKKLSHLTFVDPDKIANGLSLIWDEPHKWQRIAFCMCDDPKKVRTTLKTIYARRNHIVHQADIDIFTEEKYAFEKQEAEETVEFIRRCGVAIYHSLNVT